MIDPYYGYGLTDKAGQPLNIGDTVIFLRSTHTLNAMVERVEISGAHYWLTPSTAEMCERIENENTN